MVIICIHQQDTPTTPGYGAAKWEVTEMARTITISDLRKTGVESWSVKDNSVRGCTTKSTSDVHVGDKVVINDYFTEIIAE
jgi:hypothetical protein